ncbi:hypothetical protein N0V83_001607 [Neocucurbitaria cava]|uniref:Uncharacterized protein n=1 Tax=Neocucurbitaria cava TaxID=798079 RepID=A0A9W8YGD5_9PLEO|nr:hypothetical protein N0V83_001607 [Neocucurbitaria cava]
MRTNYRKTRKFPKTFTKAELLEVLEQKCGDALRSFPPPETFEFLHRGNRIALKVGNGIKWKRNVKKNLYLEDCETTSQATVRAAPPPLPGEVRLTSGKAGPSTSTFIHGKAAEDDEKLQTLYQNLSYTTFNDKPLNEKIKNSRGIKGDNVFGKLTANGILKSPFSNTIRVLYRFLLVYCDHKLNFEEFKIARSRVGGVNTLVRVLEEIAKRTSAVDGSEDSNATNETGFTGDFKNDSEEGSKNDAQLFAREGKGKKRALETVNDEGMALKKARKN